MRKIILASKSPRRIEMLNKYFEDADKISARVVLRIRGRDQIIEVTIPTHSFTLRNEEAQDDLYTAIDLVVDKLERQLVKNKKKMQSKSLKTKNSDFNFKNIEEDDDKESDIVVKRKKLDTKPMSEEEAILQMNMLGHDFFIYRDHETNEVDVLYRRKDGNYGIIETK
jgi:putative sigma-54 modulation protein